ncbi:MAG: extracellular solute-binding protein family 1 [Paenibacillaceae bacterium]|jgi:putative aldouronate transport system substrate-binding protein|nr:extracellular solute-binding protein family 1 [Paenibacillaceae bacterium]
MGQRKMFAGGITAALLAGLLLIGGCGSGGAEEPEASAGAAAATAGSSAAPEADMSKPVKLKWILYGETTPDSKRVWDTFNKELESVLPNTTVEFTVIDGASYNDKTRLIVAAGEDYDIMWSSGWRGDYTGKITGGAFMPVQGLIDRYAPKLKEAIPANDWAMAELNGVLYGIPSHQTIINGKSLNIPAKYYDQVTKGVDVAAIEAMSADPKISYVDVLRKIEPMVENAKTEVKEYAAAFGTPNMINKNYEVIIAKLVGIRKGDSDRKMYSLLETEEYKSMLPLVREWQKKGYFAKDMATFAKTPTNKIAATIFYTNYSLPLKQNQTADEKLYGVGNHLKRILVTPPAHSSAEGVSSAQFINYKSKNPERAIKLLEVLNTNPKLYNLLSYGIENEHYKVNEDGTLAILSQNYKMQDWLIGNTDHSIGNANNKELIEANTKAMAAAPVSPIMGFIFNMDPVKNEIASLNALINEYQLGLDYGMYEDPMAKYAEYVAKLKTAGIDKVVQEAQTQVDNWAKIKGLK